MMKLSDRETETVQLRDGREGASADSIFLESRLGQANRQLVVALSQNERLVDALFR